MKYRGNTFTQASGLALLWHARMTPSRAAQNAW
jgi:hypothetical protein